LGSDQGSAKKEISCVDKERNIEENPKGESPLTHWEAAPLHPFQDKGRSILGTEKGILQKKKIQKGEKAGPSLIKSGKGSHENNYPTFKEVGKEEIVPDS